MLGILVSGHAQFATGLVSAARLLAGDMPHLEAVDFKSTDSEEQLQENLKQALERLSDCDGIVVLTDILGGSPFKNAVTISIDRQDVVVLYGTSLAMLVELLMRTMMIGDGPAGDVAGLAEEIAEIGRSAVGRYVYEPVMQVEVEDGI